VSQPLTGAARTTILRATIALLLLAGARALLPAYASSLTCRSRVRTILPLRLTLSRGFYKRRVSF
jgi:hypothetical protein